MVEAHRPRPSTRGAGMADDSAVGQSPASSQPARRLSVRQAAFIGVGSMVGAGIFALLGAAGEVAGSAVWISFLLAGTVAGLQGYSFAKLGARYTSGGGFLEYVVRGWGDGHFTGVIAWMLLAVNAIITAMVAVSFGSYASVALAGIDRWVKECAVLILLLMTLLNILGSQTVARADRRRGRRGGDPRRVLGRHPVDDRPAPARVLGLPSAGRHRGERRADLLRVPGV